MKKTTEVAAPLNDEALALLRSMYPQEEGYTTPYAPASFVHVAGCYGG